MPRINPEVFKMPPLEYVDYVRWLNTSYRTILQDRLDPLFNLVCENDCCATVAGSDGKEERHRQSIHEVEFIVHNDTDPQKYAAEVVSVYKKKTGREFAIDFSTFNGLPAVRQFNGKDILSYAYNNPEAIYPDRALNSKLLLGSKGLYFLTRQQVLTEFSMFFPQSKRIYNKSVDQLKDYRKALITGSYRNRMVFDETRGIQYYDENIDNLRVGFKIPALRPEQRKLDLMTMTFIRKIKDQNLLDETVENLGENLPTNTLDRMDYFLKTKVDSGRLSAFKYAYSWAEREYHKVQEAYKNSRVLAETSFDREEFNSVKLTILDFIALNF